MKYLNTFLLLVIALALGANFYLDNKRDKSIQARLQALDSIPKAAQAQEASPFDKLPNNPMNASHAPPLANNTTISYEHTSHDFGRVESGPKYTANFKFTNTGKENLYISECEASCGCTVPTWPREAIKPGESGEIIVEFDSNGRTGEQLKTVTVTSNTDPNKNVLTLHTSLYLKTK